MNNTPQPQPMGSSDDELRTCFACKELKHLNAHDLCKNCKNEVRAVDDTWLVQEFKKRYSEDEVAEAIEQMWLALFAERGDVHTQKAVTAAKIEENVTYRDWYGTMNDEAVRELATSRINQLEGSLTNQEVA